MKLNLGKWLFPHLSREQRRRETRFLWVAALTGLVTASSIVVVMLLLARDKLH